MTRDPGTDPQPGDEVRFCSGELRRAVKREGDKMLVEAWGMRYWIRVDRWREWCSEGGAPAAKRE